MLNLLFTGVAVLIIAALLGLFAITRSGKIVTPVGEGSIAIGSKTFEAFPLPDYAAASINTEYKSYFIEVEPGVKIHVLEIGAGYPIYMQHGNPTSGLLYRKVAEKLPTDQVRLIMPTMVGLGFSTKVPARQHTLDNHARWMNAALEQMDLDGVVYVGQDWGGPVGMGALALSPRMLDGVVVLNTGWTAPKEKRDISRAHALVKTPIVGEILLEVFVSIFDRLHETQGDPASFPKQVADLYGRPVRESGNQKAPLALMRMVPDSPDHPSTAPLRGIEAYVETLDVPAEIVWGMRDPIFAASLPTMRRYFPAAAVTETEAGHFLQEEVPDVIAAAVMRVYGQVQASRASPGALSTTER